MAPDDPVSREQPVVADEPAAAVARDDPAPTNSPRVPDRPRVPDPPRVDSPRVSPRRPGRGGLRRDAQAVLLLAVGAALIKISVTGVAQRYVRPGMVVMLVVTALVLILLAGVTLWRSLRSARGAAPSAAEAAESLRSGWLLLLPLITVLVVVPPALGAYQAARFGTVLASHAPPRFDPLPDGDPVRLTLVDYAARAVVEQGRSMSGRRVVLAGFVLAGRDGRPYLTRLVAGCCAADARPVKVGLAGDLPASLGEGSWIEVEGGYTDQVDRDPLSGDLIPYIEVSDVRIIAVPDQPYES